MIPPRREGRSPKRFGRKGLSNRRWVVGVKFCPLVREDGSIRARRCDTANGRDGHFHDMIEESGRTTLADTGFCLSPKNGGGPGNLVICEKGERNERMLIETVFSMPCGPTSLKKIAHRVEEYVRARFAYASALYNLLLGRHGETNLSSTWAVI